MPTIYIRLKNLSDNVYLQSIIGTYSHLAWVRTENVEEEIVKLITTDDLIGDLRDVLEKLRVEIEFDEITG